jgi:hypothetical protein
MVAKVLTLLLSSFCLMVLLMATSDTVVDDEMEIEDNTQADGYSFEGPSFDRPVLNQKIKVILVATQKEMERLYKEKTGHVFDPTGKKKLQAFAFPSQTKKFCLLYIPDARKEYRPEIIGHELTHCIFGYWHPKQDE